MNILEFKTQKDFEKWLSKNYDNQEGIWVRFFNKASGIKAMSYNEALDTALCYGWIDSQVKKYDDKSHIQRYTPRRKRSIWSKRNIENVKRLTKESRMKPAGIKQVRLAKADGRWENAYDSPSNMQIPEDFMKKLSKNKKALKFFKTLNKSNLYAIYWRIGTAKKPETKEKRIKIILRMLSKEEKFH